MPADPQNITGQALVSGNGKDGVDKVSVFTGTYALAEAPNPGPGFTKGAWNCGSATMPTATTVTVTTGQDVSCTIKNTRDKGTITLTKVVDPAGAGDPASWTLSADPQNITGQALVSGNGKDGVDKVSVFTGTYALAEAPNPGPGFTKGAWNCGSATMPTATTVTVTTGQDVSCTIKNTRDKGTITLTKVVDPAGAGDPASWTLSADPQNITGQALVSGNGKDGVDKVSVFTGTYALAEAPNPGPGFTKGAWNCGSATMPTATTVTVTTGQDVSCTIKNTRDKGTITLTKVVDPAGAGDPASWTLSADPQNITGQALVSGNGKDGVDKVSVFTGTYALAEAPNPGPGFTKGAWNCGSATMPTATTVTVTTGQDVVLHDQEHP